MIFISALSHVTENQSNTCWGPSWEDARSTKLSLKASCGPCSFHLWHPRLYGCDDLSNLYWLWRGVLTAPTRIGFQHQLWTVVLQPRRHGHKLLSRNAVTWRSVTGGRLHLTLATPSKTFHEERYRMLSGWWWWLVDKTFVDVFGVFPRFLEDLLGKENEFCFATVGTKSALGIL